MGCYLQKMGGPSSSMWTLFFAGPTVHMGSAYFLMVCPLKNLRLLLEETTGIKNVDFCLLFSSYIIKAWIFNAKHGATFITAAKYE